MLFRSREGKGGEGRGFGMQVVIPEESKTNVKEELAGLCPTGALYLVD